MKPTRPDASAQDLGARKRFTFQGNLSESRHGWLRLTPAYSVHLVREQLQQHADPARAVLDPFCGTGTTLLCCAELGLDGTTVDVNPFLIWLAGAKTAAYGKGTLTEANKLVRRMQRAASAPPRSRPWIPDLHKIERWWDEHTLTELAAAFAVLRRSDASERAKDLGKIAFCRALIRCSRASFGHQSMSFSRRGQVAPPVAEELELAYDRVHASCVPLARSKRKARLGDARTLHQQRGDVGFGMLFTSPPYANRMSYVRELRPYMYWLGHLQSGREAGELDWQAIGGTWGIATSRLGDWKPSAQGMPSHLRSQVREIREQSPLLANYVARYVQDMTAHTRSAFQVMGRSSTVHYVVGNSKFYDVVVPIQEVLARQLERAGFVQPSITTLRKRTSKKELYEYLVSARKR